MLSFLFSVYFKEAFIILFSLNYSVIITIFSFIILYKMLFYFHLFSNLFSALLFLPDIDCIYLSIYQLIFLTKLIFPFTCYVLFSTIYFPPNFYFHSCFLSNFCFHSSFSKLNLFFLFANVK